MSEFTDNPLFGIDPNVAYLSPGSVAQVASNVFRAGITPMYADIEHVKRMLCRLVGDGPDSKLPEEVRDKGILFAMAEERKAEFAQQTEWKKENDAQVLAATKDRAELRGLVAANHDELEALKTEFEKEKLSRHKLRRTVLFVGRILVKKDDPVSILVGKLIVMAAAFGLSISALYHGAKFSIVFVVKWLYHYFEGK